MTEGTQETNDLFFELRLLLGADAIVAFIETHDADRFGNLVNYFKDSVYLHARNLLNALTNEYDTDIGAIPALIKSPLYGSIKKPLERYIMHVDEVRNGKGVNNRPGGKHLNEYAHELASEAKRCWQEWIDLATDPNHRQMLQSYLDRAEKSAQDDCSALEQLVKGSA